MPTSPPSAATVPRSLARATRMLGRTVLRRCPNCGGATAFAGWFTLARACTACGMPLHHGPHDHFVGTTLVNFLVAEVTWAIGFMVYLVAAWPDVNWDRVTWVSAAFMIVLPVMLYPLTRLAWLAVDLFLRPHGEGERPAADAGKLG